MNNMLYNMAHSKITHIKITAHHKRIQDIYNTHYLAIIFAKKTTHNTNTIYKTSICSLPQF